MAKLDLDMARLLSCLEFADDRLDVSTVIGFRMAFRLQGMMNLGSCVTYITEENA